MSMPITPVKRPEIDTQKKLKNSKKELRSVKVVLNKVM